MVATAAPFLALGGTSYAAFSLPANSVGTGQLKNGAVTGAKLHPGAVTASAVKAHSLQAVDFAAGQLPAGLPGPQGLGGAQGPPGAQGAPGPASNASCVPDLSNAPGLVAPIAYASLAVDGTSYPVTKFEIGGIGCPTPSTLITVASPLQDPLPALLGTGPFNGGQLVLENSGATPLVTFTFTGGRVTSFADREDLVQVTITVAGITRSVP